MFVRETRGEDLLAARLEHLGLPVGWTADTGIATSTAGLPTADRGLTAGRGPLSASQRLPDEAWVSDPSPPSLLRHG